MYISKRNDTSKLTSRTMWVGANLDGVRDGAPPPILSVAGWRELHFEAEIKWAIASGATVDLGEPFGREEVYEP